MDFKKYLKIEAEKVEAREKKHLQIWQAWISEKIPTLLPHAKAFSISCIGGKKLRGILISLGFEIGEGKGVGIVDIAAAYEILHTAILAHDDVIDQSPIRRAKPSLYIELGGGHHGISQTISLGDLGFFLATKIISQSKFDDKLKSKALEYVSKTMMDTALGEMLDVELPFLGKERQQKDVLSIMKYKTARYTISSPLQLGAILSGAEKDLIDKLGAFGENLGIAFQIQDDILGVFGQEKELGKSNKSDIEEGKNTILIIEAIKNADKAQMKVLGKYYGKGKLSDEGLERVRDVFIKTKALEYAQKVASEYINEAKLYIPKITENKKLREKLEKIAEYLIERKR